MRADARRNREQILASAGELFARLGDRAEMEQIAEHAGVGMGTLYRHFPSKQALLLEIVRLRFAGMADVARAAEQIADPGTAFETVLRTYLEAAEGDAAFQLALLGSNDLQWKSAEAEKAEFRAIVGRIIERAVASGQVRPDLTADDFPMISCGVMSTMYFKPSASDWRRHLELALDGVRTSGSRPRQRSKG
jgi:AcrR family transcriptional regulator